MNERMEKFLQHPITQAVSGATLGAVVGFCFSLMLGSLIFGPGTAMIVTATLGAVVLSTLTARSALNHQRTRLGPDSLAWVASFAGATMIVGTSLSLLGLGGGALLIVAASGGVLISSLLAVLR